jgi:hypothetical protein
MIHIIIAVIGIPLFALVFSGTTMGLGLVWSRFKIEGGKGGYKEIYIKFLIVAAVYILLTLAGIGGFIGLFVMGLAYKYTFGAGMFEAFIIGLIGGTIGWVIFFFLAAAGIFGATVVAG